jgi:hypothetical protein
MCNTSAVLPPPPPHMSFTKDKVFRISSPKISIERSAAKVARSKGAHLEFASFKIGCYAAVTLIGTLTHSRTVASFRAALFAKRLPAADRLPGSSRQWIMTSRNSVAAAEYVFVSPVAISDKSSRAAQVSSRLITPDLSLTLSSL